MDGETVKFGDPFPVHAAHGVARQGGENVTIGEDDMPRAEQGQDLAFVAIREVRGVNERERGRGEKLPFLAFARRFLDEDGGVPFGEENAISFELEPAFDEIDLGGLSGTVQSFDGDELA